MEILRRCLMVLVLLVVALVVDAMAFSLATIYVLLTNRK